MQSSFLNAMVASGISSIVQFHGHGNFGLVGDSLPKYTEILHNVVKSGVVKLVIFDLDNTMWQGELMENIEVKVDTGKFDFVKSLVKAGIMCSLCSKNDFQVVFNFLSRFGLWEFFVFPQVSVVNQKSSMIKSILQGLNLRPENCIFIDDELRNRSEVSQAYFGQLVCLPPDLFFCLQKCTFPQKSDWENRQNAYKVLEQKATDKALDDDEEMFLLRSSITVSLNCDPQQDRDRIVELCARANQLNYTKSRLSGEELDSLFNNNDVQSVSVSVTDRYGDYGVSGFYSLEKKTNQLIHFVFSCRLLGMRVETAIFNALGAGLEVVGEVSVPMPNSNDTSFIKFNNARFFQEIDLKLAPSILLKGGCNMAVLEGMLTQKHRVILLNNEEKQKGNIQPAVGHTEMILLWHRKNRDDMPLSSFWQAYIQDFDFLDIEVNFLIMDFWKDVSTNLYKHNTSSFYFPFGSALQPSNLELEHKLIPVEHLQYLQENFTNTGLISGQHFAKNLKAIRDSLHHRVIMVLCLFPEYDSPGHNRVEKFKELNSVMENFSKEDNSVKILDFGKHAKSYENDTINDGAAGHFKRFVYQRICEDLLKMLSK